MQIIKVDQNSSEWFDLRKGKITGSKLGDIYSPRGGRKIGFYQLLADRLEEPIDEDEDARARGTRLEVEACQKASAELDIDFTTDCGMWVSDVNSAIAISPDASTKDLTIAMETKCLGGARHMEAVDKGDELPDNGYRLQAIQYFLVNENLKTLYFVFYRPENRYKTLHIIPMHREDLKDDILFWLDYEQKVLKEVDEYIAKVAF